ARLFRLVHISAAIELDDLVVGPQILVGIRNVGGNLLGSFTQLFLRLRDRIPRSRDFALVAVKNRQWNVEGESGAAHSRSVCVVHTGGEVLFGIYFSERQLASGGRDALLCGD